jgi:hypothetical protein
MAAPDTRCQPPEFPGTRKRGQRRRDSGSGSSPHCVLGMSAADLIADRYPRIPGNHCGPREMIFFW